VPSMKAILAGVADAVKGREPHPLRSGLPLPTWARGPGG